MNTILTYRKSGYGSYFDFNRPDLHDYDIEEIAHALSLICRFNGHVKHHYSVAQHSVLVSDLVPSEYAYEGLMHDAHEAYVGDVPTPLKRMIPDYRECEGRAQVWVRHNFDAQMTAHCNQEVKRADIMALAIEKRHLLALDPDPQQWGVLDGVKPPSDIRLPKMTPEEAERLFLDRYEELTS